MEDEDFLNPGIRWQIVKKKRCSDSHGAAGELDLNSRPNRESLKTETVRYSRRAGRARDWRCGEIKNYGVTRRLRSETSQGKVRDEQLVDRCIARSGIFLIWS